MERTFAIIKPDAVERNLIGKIVERIESKGFKKERPFFNDLTAYMVSGPVVLMVLEKDNAIAGWRELMGATNPTEADPGTIRKDFAINLEKNSAHGSDSPETAAFEIKFFFSQIEILP